MKKVLEIVNAFKENPIDFILTLECLQFTVYLLLIIVILLISILV